MSSSEQPDRRAFLKGLGTVGATGVAAMVSADAVAEPQATPPPAAAAPTQPPETAHAYIFLSPPEAAFIEAAVDRLIPGDDLSPGGTDCGVATFIDRQLAGGITNPAERADLIAYLEQTTMNRDPAEKK